jgi:hypothetical protein
MKNKIKVSPVYVSRIVDTDGNSCSGKHHDAINHAQITYPFLQHVSMAKIGMMIESGTLEAFIA